MCVEYVNESVASLPPSMHPPDHPTTESTWSQSIRSSKYCFPSSQPLPTNCSANATINIYPSLNLCSFFKTVCDLFILFSSFLFFSFFFILQPAWVIENNRPEQNWPTKGVVRFDKYSTRYRPGLDLVLHSISCTVHSGEKVIRLKHLVS